MGCPDSDGDGIANAKDACPDVAGLAEFNGCIDSDGDGISDDKDRCPSESGSEALKRCPDTDGDSVADVDDKCPDVAGLAKNKGCPEVSQAVKEVFTKALQGIQFESGRDVIKSSSFTILNNVADIMKENPAYKLFIQGHTDSQGDDAMNQELSDRRSAAVKAYLEGKAVAGDRMRSQGYGESNPVADNGTAAGRAKNRRVEF
ncbi:MAG: OmpA family protein [Bacteroidetes bacterium]|nr:OmpA family protein [Bacteroidota bacterium]MDA0972537.1 OmpA family protein [Bacteroidota bacterium]